MKDLSRIEPKLKTGQEYFQLGEEQLDTQVIDFWRWMASNLVVNNMRGFIAEYIVGLAAGMPKNAIREEWDAYDVVNPKGLKIEVKSAAYLQSWEQKKLSTIRFAIASKSLWSDQLGWTEERGRPADVYV